MARKQILTPVILPLLLCGFLFQAIVPLIRILTTYRALDVGLGAGAVGLISGTFALLPALFAVSIGRFNDRGGAGRAVMGGTAATFLACLVLWLAPPGLATLLIGNAILGIGQTLGMSALQIITSRSASRVHRDSLLGNYMVVLSLGQAIGPLAVGLTSDRDLLLAVTAGLAGFLVLAGAALFGVVLRPTRRTRGAAIPLRSIAATPGLPWIIVIGSLCVAAQDLLLAFLPILGAERGIPPAFIGALLSIRAVAAMVSRALFGPSVRYFGRLRLMLLAAGLAGIALLSLALPLPLWAVTAALAATGFGLGITLTSSVSLAMTIAPPAARGTALSLRLTANRLAQFGLPLISGVAVASLGAGGVFALSGAAILGAAVARPRGLSASK